jgi:hypothetical protein
MHPIRPLLALPLLNANALLTPGSTNVRSSNKQLKSSNAESYDSVLAAVAALSVKLDTKISGLDTKLSGVDTRLITLDERLITLDEKLFGQYADIKEEMNRQTNKQRKSDMSLEGILLRSLSTQMHDDNWGL